jgi:hypothetical protein
MSSILGDFYEALPPTDEYLTLSFSLSANARQERWRNYGLSADFLGDYFATFFPGPSDGGGIARKDAVKATISYIANELIENAIKYSDRDLNHPVGITLYLYESSITCVVTNHASTTTVGTFQSFLTKLFQADLDTFYMQQLEASAERGTDSGLGLLTIALDYDCKLGWKFVPTADSRSIEVIAMASIDI